MSAQDLSWTLGIDDAALDAASGRVAANAKKIGDSMVQAARAATQAQAQAAQQLDQVYSQLLIKRARAQGDEITAELRTLDAYYDERVSMAKSAAEREAIAEMEAIDRVEVYRRAALQREQDEMEQAAAHFQRQGFDPTSKKQTYNPDSRNLGGIGDRESMKGKEAAEKVARDEENVQDRSQQRKLISLRRYYLLWQALRVATAISEFKEQQGMADFLNKAGNNKRTSDFEFERSSKLAGSVPFVGDLAFMIADKLSGASKARAGMQQGIETVDRGRENLALHEKAITLAAEEKTQIQQIEAIEAQRVKDAAAELTIKLEQGQIDAKARNESLAAIKTSAAYHVSEARRQQSETRESDVLSSQSSAREAGLRVGDNGESADLEAAARELQLKQEAIRKKYGKDIYTKAEHQESMAAVQEYYSKVAVITTAGERRVAEVTAETAQMKLVGSRKFNEAEIQGIKDSYKKQREGAQSDKEREAINAQEKVALAEASKRQARESGLAVISIETASRLTRMHALKQDNAAELEEIKENYRKQIEEAKTAAERKALIDARDKDVASARIRQAREERQSLAAIASETMQMRLHQRGDAMSNLVAQFEAIRQAYASRIADARTQKERDALKDQAKVAAQGAAYDFLHKPATFMSLGEVWKTIQSGAYNVGGNVAERAAKAAEETAQSSAAAANLLQQIYTISTAPGAANAPQPAVLGGP